MASNIVTARKIILRKSFLTKFRQFSSSPSITDGIQKKSDKTAQPLEPKDTAVSSSKWNDFLFAFATSYSSSTKQGTPNFFSAFMGALKQVVTTDGPPAPTSWTWTIKSENTYHFGEKDQEPEKLKATTKLSEEEFVIMIELVGFREENLTLVVEKNMMYILGNVNMYGETDLINEAFDINPEHLFDANKVTAKLVDGTLKVTFPKGTRETMATETFHIKWT